MKYFCLLLFAFLQSISSFSQSADLPQVSVKANEFIINHKPFVLRGLNTSDPEKLSNQGHWNLAYFEAMKSWGANVVRFPVHPAAWRRLGKEKYLKLLDEGVLMARSQKMYVIIDWHSIGNLRTEMYQADGYETTQKETFEFWRTMAKHFKGNHTVAFFELFNEPTTYNGQLGTCTWQDWKKLNEEIIGIIRAHENTAIPLVAGFNWAYDLTQIATEPINAEGIGYVSHPYPQKRPKPWEAKWTKDWGFVKEKYPLLAYVIEVEGKKLYLNKVNRYVLSPVMAKLGHDPLIAYEELIQALVIREISDMEVLEDDDLFLSAVTQIAQIVDLKKSTITKL
jgi:hypothetical protein